VRWSLAAKGPGACRLSLTHALPPGCKAEDAARLGGGWHAFLDAVPDAADGLDAAAPAYDAAARKTLEATYTDRLAEADRAATDGSLRDDGATIVHFERRIDRPPAKVWAALTDPRIVHNWLGAAEIEPRVGGRYVFRFHDTDTVMTGTITAFEPERLLEYSWSENTVAMPPSRARWELAPDGDGCRLVLTHRFDPSVPRADIVPFLGGWEGLLDVLAQASDGAFMPYRPWDLYDVLYRAKYL
ncbi:MAG TPA: SRPBCC domain-containing protein, partial [Rhizomicrobium sp.]